MNMAGYVKSGHFVAVYWNREKKKGYSEYIHHSSENNILAETSDKEKIGFELVCLYLCKSRREAEALREYEDVSLYRNRSYMHPSENREGIYYPYYMNKNKLKDLLEGGA